MDMGGLRRVVIIIALIVVLVAFTMQALYVRTLYRALNRVGLQNRSLNPAFLWLLLIPYFNLVWGFVVASQLTDSLRNEFRARNLDNGSDYGKLFALLAAGLTFSCIAFFHGAFLLPASVQQSVAPIVGIAWHIAILLHIIMWIKVAGYQRDLASDDDFRRSEFERRFDDDDDDSRGGTPRPQSPPSDSIQERDAGRYQ